MSDVARPRSDMSVDARHPETLLAHGNVMGSRIHAGDFDSVVRVLVDWADRRESRYVCICNVHSVVTASTLPALAQAINSADLCTPDGWPVALALRLDGHKGQPRIAGPDLMWACCAAAEREGQRIYLYGSRDETLIRLQRALRRDFPKLTVAGTWSPPFRDLTPDEEKQAVGRINESGAHLVFVGLGCPKQEIWMSRQRGQIRAVTIGVGAAFDFHAGVIRRAPKWMQNSGLEWMHRLASEPRRLAGRYLRTNSRFVLYLLGRFIRPRSTG